MDHVGREERRLPVVCEHQSASAVVLVANGELWCLEWDAKL